MRRRVGKARRAAEVVRSQWRERKGMGRRVNYSKGKGDWR